MNKLDNGAHRDSPVVPGACLIRVPRSMPMRSRRANSVGHFFLEEAFTLSFNRAACAHFAHIHAQPSLFLHQVLIDEFLVNAETVIGLIWKSAATDALKEARLPV